MSGVDAVTMWKAKWADEEWAKKQAIERAEKAEESARERYAAILEHSLALHAEQIRAEEREALLASVRCIRDGNPHHVCNCSCAAIRALGGDR